MGKFERIANKICDLFGVSTTDDQSGQSSSSDIEETEI